MNLHRSGVIIGLVGTLLVALAASCWHLIEYCVPSSNIIHVQFLAKDVYYISELPSDLHYHEVALIAGMSFLITAGYALSKLSSAQTQPARSLRYEIRKQG